VRWLRGQSRLGILGQSPREAAITIGIAVLTIATSLVYDALNHGPNRIFLRTPIDDLIPVVGVFPVPYVSLRPFVYGTLVLFLVFRVNTYRSAALSMTVVFAVSYLFYVFLQSYIQRPEITGDDVFSRLIGDVYASDQPYNDFPRGRARLGAVTLAVGSGDLLAAAEHAAHYDALTGLPNRLLLTERLTAADRGEREPKRASRSCTRTWMTSVRSTTRSAMKWKTRSYASSAVVWGG
jgi:hypothetical protein